VKSLGLLATGGWSLADAAGRIYGVVVGIVTDNKDPDALGRIKVKLPWLSPDAESDWARIATLMAGNERGAFFLPEVDDEVLVAFEHGDLRFPYVLGALWNGTDKPPESNSDGQNDRRLFRSRSGMMVGFNDADGNETIEIADKDGRTKVVVEMSGKKITLSSSGDIEVKAADGTVSISAKTIKLDSTGKTEVTATGTLDVKGQTVNIKGQPTVNIN
jgi:uncharacterized protein involved in type VI secretion and phage assembly